MKYDSFYSFVELGFYTALASHKIDYDKLDDSARKLLGLYSPAKVNSARDGSRLEIAPNALVADDIPRNMGMCRAEGIIKNVNTIEEFKNADRSGMVNRCAQTIWDATLDGTIYSCPSLLTSFVVISFADLKKYKFHYHFAFPALQSSPSWDIEPGQAIERLTSEQSSTLYEKLSTWRYSVDTRQHGFFLIKRIKEELNELEAGWRVGALGDYELGFFEDKPDETIIERLVGFTDPSTETENPGWPLRNLLVLVRKRWGFNKVRVLCYKETQATRDMPRSFILPLKVVGDADGVDGTGAVAAIRQLSMSETLPKVASGWERNEEGKLATKVANLGQTMDPLKLAETQVDLNNKLMKWRIAPDLDLDKLKNTKCLLLGAGTLGSYVSRILQGWGVRRITFIDNGTVSYSNPVRQPLFTHKDCIGGQTHKATRAAAALKEINPNVDAQGYVMSVPMAGHPIRDEANTKADFEKLQELFQAHDAIFLLMDTRESRWLPTVMGKAMGKIVLNAALGFDTYVVMRHGVKPVNGTSKEAEELGCYFCNDVVAPADSLRDQTLDQQCTVTRPEIAPLASGRLLALFASVVQHPLGPAAPAPASQDADRGSHPLGIVPHTVREFLASFQQMVIKGSAYECCSACSTGIIEAYRSSGWDFVKRALNEKGYVEEVSGLKEVQKMAEEMEDDLEWDEGGEGELL
ncbi:E1-like protein-activating [Terfezia boudieri ATCC MYA-4762]|uniref:Ubiquitin-like modifier-activating enzyme ATG7 n=1 Tax=Terfezia boudieri ATCC MYA-4762 TaxID=1051890 RepID=A0A3N4M3I8_9PEZI|nr:E1-like protein-activating [Terfezia boudieri ATCC MYA-4762]